LMACWSDNALVKICCNGGFSPEGTGIDSTTMRFEYDHEQRKRTGVRKVVDCPVVTQEYNKTMDAVDKNNKETDRRRLRAHTKQHGHAPIAVMSSINDTIENAQRVYMAYGGTQVRRKNNAELAQFYLQQGPDVRERKTVPPAPSSNLLTPMQNRGKKRKKMRLHLALTLGL